MEKWQVFKQLVKAGKFYITEAGEIYRTEANGLMERAEVKNKCGYLIIGFTYYKRSYIMVAHRLIYEYFTERPIPKNNEIHHADGNRENNNYYNLDMLPCGVHRCAHSLLWQERK